MENSLPLGKKLRIGFLISCMLSVIVIAYLILKPDWKWEPQTLHTIGYLLQIKNVSESEQTIAESFRPEGFITSLTAIIALIVLYMTVRQKVLYRILEVFAFTTLPLMMLYVYLMGTWTFLFK
jgi:hypothetical protein